MLYMTHPSVLLVARANFVFDNHVRQVSSFKFKMSEGISVESDQSNLFRQRRPNFSQ